MVQVTAGKTMGASETVDNDKLNLIAVPSVALEAGDVTDTEVAGAGFATTDVTWVDKGGNDGTGTKENARLPFLTVQAAITASDAGTTVVVRPGSYTEDITMKAGVDLHLMTGVIIVGDILVDTAATVNITGQGWIDNTGGNALSVTHASADVTVSIPLLESDDADAIDLDAGTLTLKGAVKVETKGGSMDAIQKDGGTLNLDGVIELKSTLTGFGINAGSAQSVAIKGLVLTNTSAGSNVTFTNSLLRLGFATGAPAITFTDLDATPSVVGGYYFETGTSAVSITDFDGGVTGQEIVIQSKGAITYDVTSSGLTGGTTDIVTADGDLTKWIYDGTDWILISFTDQSDDLS